MGKVGVVVTAVFLSIVFIGTVGVADVSATGVPDSNINTTASDPIVVNGSANASGADYHSIQAAIDNATDGDTIIVRPGKYAESPEITKNITLYAPERAILTGGSEDGFTASIKTTGGTPVHTVVSGFTLKAPNADILIEESGGGVINNINSGRYISDLTINFGGLNQNSEMTGNWEIQNTQVGKVIKGGTAYTNGRPYYGDLTLQNTSIQSLTYKEVNDDISVGDNFGDINIEGGEIRNFDIANATYLDNISIENAQIHSVIADFAEADEIAINDSWIGHIAAKQSSSKWNIFESHFFRVSWREHISANESNGTWDIYDSSFAPQHFANGIMAANTEGKWEIHNSSFLEMSESGIVAYGSNKTLDATGNWWEEQKNSNCVGNVDCSNPNTGSHPDDTLIIDKQGGGDFQSIQVALGYADDGDIIKIKPGSYREYVDIKKNVSLTAQEGAIIQLGGANSGVGFPGRHIRIYPNAKPSINGVKLISKFHHSAAIDASGSNTNWSIEDVEISGVNTAINAINSTSDWQIRNIRIQGGSDYSDWSQGAVLAFGSSGSWSITNATINDDEGGIVASGSTGDWTVRNVKIPGDNATTNEPYSGSHAINARESTGNWTVHNLSSRLFLTSIDGASSTGDWKLRDSSVQSLQGCHKSEAINVFNSSGSWKFDNVLVTQSARGIDARQTSGQWTMKNTSITNISQWALSTKQSSGAWIVNRTLVRNANASLEPDTDYCHGTGSTPASIIASDSESNWSIRNTLITNSTAGGLRARNTSQLWNVSHSGFINISGSKIDATEANHQAKATQNWWGSPDGPDPNDCIGNVTCENPITDRVELGLWDLINRFKNNSSEWLLPYLEYSETVQCNSGPNCVSEGVKVSVAVGNEKDTVQNESVSLEVQSRHTTGSNYQTVNTTEISLGPGEYENVNFTIPPEAFSERTRKGFNTKINRTNDKIIVTYAGNGSVDAGNVYVDSPKLSDTKAISDITSYEDNRSITATQGVALPLQYAENESIRLLIGNQTNFRITSKDKTRNGTIGVFPNLNPESSFTISELPIQTGKPIYFGFSSQTTGGLSQQFKWDFADSVVENHTLSFWGTTVTKRTFTEADLTTVGATLQRDNGVTSIQIEQLDIKAPSEFPPEFKINQCVDAGYSLEGYDFINRYTLQSTNPAPIENVTFAPSWRGPVNKSKASGGSWSETFNLHNVSGFGHLTVYARNEYGKNHETITVDTTDPPQFAEILLGSSLSSTPKCDVKHTEKNEYLQDIAVKIKVPEKVPKVGGKDIGIDPEFAYGLQYQFAEESVARHYIKGGLGVSFPVKAFIVSVKGELSGSGELAIPSWRNKNVLVVTGTQRASISAGVPLQIPKEWPVVGGHGFSANASIGSSDTVQIDTKLPEGGAMIQLREGTVYHQISGSGSIEYGLVGQRIYGKITGKLGKPLTIAADGESIRDGWHFEDSTEWGGSLIASIGGHLYVPGWPEATVDVHKHADVKIIDMGTKPPGPFSPSRNMRKDAVTTDTNRQNQTSNQIENNSLYHKINSTQDRSRSHFTPTNNRLTNNELTDDYPSVTGVNGTYLVAWNGATKSGGNSSAREIYVQRYDPERGWNPRELVTEDTAYNTKPTIASSEEGRLVAWQRIERNRSIDSFSDAMNNTEIAYKTFNGSSWSETKKLTSNNRYDGDPVAVSSDNGFVLAWEQDQNGDVRDKTSDSVYYSHLARNGTVLGERYIANGTQPRLAKTPNGTRLAITSFAEGVEGNLLLLEGNAVFDLVSRFRVDNITSYDVTANGLAWTNGSTVSSPDIQFWNGKNTTEIPLGHNSTAIRELRLAESNGRVLVQYQGRNPAVDWSSKRTYYQIARNDNWSPPRAVGEVAGTDKMVWEHSVEADENGFFTVGAAMNFSTDTPSDLYYVNHKFRSDLALSLPEEERIQLRNATIGDTMNISFVIKNTGDSGTGQEVDISTISGENVTNSTVEAIAPGEELRSSIDTRIGRTGKLELIVDPRDEIEELSESNNRASVTVVRPDIAVKDVTQQRRDNEFVVNVTMENVGNTTVSNISLALSQNDLINHKWVNSNSSLGTGEQITRTIPVASANVNSSITGLVRARAIQPGKDKNELNGIHSVPLYQPDVRIIPESVSTYAVENRTFASVFIENTGGGSTAATLRVSADNETKSRRISIPTSESGMTIQQQILPISVSDGDVVRFNVTNLTDSTPGNNRAVIVASPQSISELPINNSNSPPAAPDITYELNSSGRITVSNNVLAKKEYDPDYDLLQTSVASPPTNGSVTVYGDGEFTYSAGRNFSGKDTFTYLLSDQVGGTDTGSITIYSFNNSSLVAKTGPNRTVGMGETIQFDGTESTAESEIVSYEWKFKDEGMVTGPNPTYEFEQPGQYNVTLTVTDDNGVSAKDSVFINVEDLTPPSAVIGDDRNIVPGDTVNFDGSSSSDNHGIIRYEWDLNGDGKIDARGPKPSYTYTSPGVYSITLSVMDEAGNSDSESLTVKVKDDETRTPTDTPTSTPTDTPTSTPTDTPTSTPTDTPTSTPTDTPTSTPTDRPTDTKSTVIGCETTTQEHETKTQTKPGENMPPKKSETPTRSSNDGINLSVRLVSPLVIVLLIGAVFVLRKADLV